MREIHLGTKDKSLEFTAFGIILFKCFYLLISYLLHLFFFYFVDCLKSELELAAEDEHAVALVS
mgnify:CR=1 FL=1